MSVARWWRPLALVVAVVALAGCGSPGPKRYGVKGTVAYKGKPIEAGLISFVQTGTEASAGGAAIVGGKYEIPTSAGLLAGEYQVIISVPTAGPPPKRGAPAADQPPGEGAGEKETRETLPAKYNAKTELKREVKAGEDNEFNFDLK
ncbi:MAG TPA: hypothetical protein VFG68_18040 [Fimbriiglobus sp.]|nr:hypothetical protein [Fimbriiglobus sp.]